jgi:hypothetical protein
MLKQGKSFCVIAAVAASLTLAGCTSKSKPVEFTATQVQKQKLNLPPPDAVLQNPVKWYGIAKNAPPGERGSIEFFWSEMEKQGLTTGLALSTNDFKKLLRNEEQLKRYIRQQDAIIRAYRKYYEENSK